MTDWYISTSCGCCLDLLNHSEWLPLNNLCLSLTLLIKEHKCLNLYSMWGCPHLLANVWLKSTVHFQTGIVHILGGEKNKYDIPRRLPLCFNHCPYYWSFRPFSSRLSTSLHTSLINLYANVPDSVPSLQGLFLSSQMWVGLRREFLWSGSSIRLDYD